MIKYIKYFSLVGVIFITIVIGVFLSKDEEPFGGECWFLYSNYVAHAEDSMSYKGEYTTEVSHLPFIDLVYFNVYMDRVLFPGFLVKNIFIGDSDIHIKGEGKINSDKISYYSTYYNKEAMLQVAELSLNSKFNFMLKNINIYDVLQRNLGRSNWDDECNIDSLSQNIEAVISSRITFNTTKKYDVYILGENKYIFLYDDARPNILVMLLPISHGNDVVVLNIDSTPNVIKSILSSYAAN